MVRFAALAMIGLVSLAAACGENVPLGPASQSASGTGGTVDTGTGNADGDCMTDGEELALGTDPNAVDSDADGVSDCDELDCVSDPTDGAEVCYACGWQHNDPGNLVTTGVQLGDVVENMSLVDQCGETVRLWDFAGDYTILFLTAVW